MEAIGHFPMFFKNIGVWHDFGCHKDVLGFLFGALVCIARALLWFLNNSPGPFPNLTLHLWSDFHFAMMSQRHIANVCMRQRLASESHVDQSGQHLLDHCSMKL